MAWLPQTSGDPAWQGVNIGYVVAGAFSDALPWRDDQPWLDIPAWSPQAAVDETWTVQGA